jgi:hypothetical protein
MSNEKVVNIQKVSVIHLMRYYSLLKKKKKIQSKIFMKKMSSNDELTSEDECVDVSIYATNRKKPDDFGR